MTEAFLLDCFSSNIWISDENKALNNLYFSYWLFSYFVNKCIPSISVVLERAGSFIVQLGLAKREVSPGKRIL